MIFDQIKLQAVMLKAVFIISILFVSISHAYALSDPDTALDEYVNTPDAAYDFAHFATMSGPDFTLHVFSMTSQEWRSADEVDRTRWEHWLAVIVPNTVVSETSMLIVAGGSNKPLPDLDAGEVQIAGQVALATQSIVSIITQVPNQPLKFPNEVDGLREDSLVAYSWDKAMDTGDFSWPVYLPMVKSVVRAMDTVQAVAPAVAEKIVNDFVVVGFSKRGAITWLTAVVDPRVKAISPGVIDFLNVAPHIEHHYSAYGFYSPAVQPYVNKDIVRRVRTPEGQDLLKVIDPYSYLDRLTMPKFLLNSPGDQFFPSDSARHYYQDLLGDNLIRYVPNTDHSLADSNGSVENALASLVTWYANILFDVPRPQISWEKNESGVTVSAFPPPSGAALWRATNENGRDFRKDLIGDAWMPAPLAGSGSGIYQITVEEPTTGWTAYFAEFYYPGAGGFPQTYSTRVFVTPDTLPFEVIDPIGDPKGKGFWKKQIKVAVTGKGKAKIDAATIQSYFPIPVFDTHIENIDSAYDLFSSKGHSPDIRALQHCLAVRLNIAHKELGWYSLITEKEDEHKYSHPQDSLIEGGLLWARWQTAHDAFIAGNPRIAKEICEEINEL